MSAEENKNNNKILSFLLEHFQIPVDLRQNFFPTNKKTEISGSLGSKK
jgi:predicted SPOUT superfamily RNA methylase MTH1